MHIPFKEPVSPRYIYINPVTNKVHMLVPVVGGQEISTDNTCKIMLAYRDFFEGGALQELTVYIEALNIDIKLLREGDAQRASKEARLAQMVVYIEAISAMRMEYSNARVSLLERPSNLYSIQLRPRNQGHASRVVNPVFNVIRADNPSGIPLSFLYCAIHSTFPTTEVKTTDLRSLLITAVLDALPASAGFAEIQEALREQSLALFELTIDFTQQTDGTPVTKEVIDGLMGFEGNVTREDYIDALLGACALNLWETLPTPPFYSIPATTSVDEKTERLSILTQFFLANLNVYCKARGISTQNFGVVLDASSALSNRLVSVVSTALTEGKDVERAIYKFCNRNTDVFGLSRPLNEKDLTALRQTFEHTYRTIMATNENPHMDDFMILDKEAIGKTAKFVTHQGSICVNFAELITPTAASSNPDYFACIRADFEVHPTEVPHRNECVEGDLEIDVETLLSRINEEQFERLPEAAKEVCRVHPIFQAHLFLHDVAKGKQDAAEALLIATPENTQTLLRTQVIFNDYSGRIFNCTAYEYAYWANDTHMCRMLLGHMDEETKAVMAARIDKIERIDAATGQPVGLVYNQAGQEHRSAHFDFTPLKVAYNRCIDAYSKLHNWAPLDSSCWLDMGKEQRNVPAHVAQEYCRPDRSFNPRPEFNEEALPRELTFFNLITSRQDSWFPLPSSNSGLGFDFSLVRAGLEAQTANLWPQKMSSNSTLIASHCGFDLTAIIRLDKVRKAELTQLREHLNPPALFRGMTM